jgi:hypothetical protein
MGTYNLFPGLKHILEDKRIRRFGVPDEEYKKYLMAEQFVIDIRKFQHENPDYNQELFATIEDMRYFSIAKAPFDNFIIHAISKTEPAGGDSVVLTFYYKVDEEDQAKGTFTQWPCFPSKQGLSYFLGNDDFIEQAKQISEYSYAALIVSLATKGAIKDRHECKRSQRAINGKPHKKGSAGYTIIRPPEPHELEGCIPDGSTKRPHFRRGHIRKLDPENRLKWIWVSPCFIHGEPEVQRKAYLVT